MAAPPTEPRRRGRVVACVVVTLIAAVLLASHIQEARWREPRPFDEVVWRESEVVGGRSARHAMAGDLRDQLLRDRPERAAVYELLGTPFVDSASDPYWTLGMAPGLTVTDDCGLTIEFDADRRVAAVRISHETE